MYESERERIAARDFPGGFDEVGGRRGVRPLDAGGRHRPTCSRRRARTARGSSTSGTTRGWSSRASRSTSSSARRQQSFWTGLRAKLGAWDEMIRELNARTGVAADL